MCWRIRCLQLLITLLEFCLQMSAPTCSKVCSLPEYALLKRQSEKNCCLFESHNCGGLNEEPISWWINDKHPKLSCYFGKIIQWFQNVRGSWLTIQWNWKLYWMHLYLETYENHIRIWPFFTISRTYVRI